MNITEEGAARAQIANLIAVYNNCGDRGQIREILGIFTDDAEYDLGVQVHHGKQEISDFMLGVVDGSVASSFPTSKAGGNEEPASNNGSIWAGARHHLTTSRIEFSADTEADAWTYFYVMRRGNVFLEGLYIDHFRLTSDGWRLARRRVKELWKDYSRAG